MKHLSAIVVGSGFVRFVEHLDLDCLMDRLIGKKKQGPGVSCAPDAVTYSNVKTLGDSEN